MTHILEKWDDNAKVWKRIAAQGRALPILDLLYETAGRCWEPGDRIRIFDDLKLLVVWESHK